MTRKAKPNDQEEELDRAPYIPTPLEIYEAAAEVRSGWSEVEHERRSVGYVQWDDRVGWTVPEVRVGV